MSEYSKKCSSAKKNSTETTSTPCRTRTSGRLFNSFTFRVCHEAGEGGKSMHTRVFTTRKVLTDVPHVRTRNTYIFALFRYFVCRQTSFHGYSVMDVCYLILFLSEGCCLLSVIFPMSISCRYQQRILASLSYSYSFGISTETQKKVIDPLLSPGLCPSLCHGSGLFFNVARRTVA